MTKSELLKKFKELKKENNKMIDEKLEKLLKSGAINLPDWNQDFVLAKLIMCAMGKEMQHQWKPLHDSKKMMREVNNFYAMM